MPREFNRTDRVADHIRREVAQLIQQSMRDPRVAMTSVTDVEVSRDLSHAKVFVTFLNVDEQKEIDEGVAVLNKAAGFLRSQLAKVTTMRTTPKLAFYFDGSLRYGAKLSGLIDDAVKADATRHDDSSPED